VLQISPIDRSIGFCVIFFKRMQISILPVFLRAGGLMTPLVGFSIPQYNNFVCATPPIGFAAII
jgi:hypothetical protein